MKKVHEGRHFFRPSALPAFDGRGRASRIDGHGSNREDGLIGVDQAGAELIVRPVGAEAMGGHGECLTQGIGPKAGPAFKHQRRGSGHIGGRKRRSGRQLIGPIGPEQHEIDAGRRHRDILASIGESGIWSFASVAVTQ